MYSNINERIIDIQDSVIEALEFISANEQELKQAYREDAKNDESIYELGTYSIEKEEVIPVLVKDTLVKTSEHLKDLSSYILDESKEHTKQIMTFIDEYLDRIEYAMLDERNAISSWLDVVNDNDYESDYKAIALLIQFADVGKNIVLIGGNGSGKSSLAQLLKGNDSAYMTVIPAQKFLFYIDENSIKEVNVEDAKSDLLMNTIEMSKSKDDYGYTDYQKYHFTKLINAMRGDFYGYLQSCYEEGRLPKKNCVYETVRSIIKSNFEDVELRFGINNERAVFCKKGDEEYSVNSMSEGEKAALYYAASVMLAPRNSHIVVDEPETYLNPSLANTLWDQLIKEREDCKFIFITHSIDFTLARKGFQIIWIKNYQHPDKYDFEIVKDNYSLPKALMTEILGSKKPILFCEGDDKSSLDYKVYHALFHEKYTVIPVGGHARVIQCCRVLNEANWINNEGKGIIDGDLHNCQIKERLGKEGITVMPFNEIEMLLISDEVMEETLKAIYPKKYLDHIRKFKKAIWKNTKESKKRIALEIVRVKVNEHLEEQKLEKGKNIEAVKSNYQKLINIDIEGIYNDAKGKIDEMLSSGDYNYLLRIYNLKKEASQGLANKLLDNNYEDKAVEHIESDVMLQENLRKKYFHLI